MAALKEADGCTVTPYAGRIWRHIRIYYAYGR
jgi:hypothetical protein